MHIQKENVSKAANAAASTPTVAETSASNEVSLRPIEQESKRQERLWKARKSRQFELRAKQKQMGMFDVTEDIDASPFCRDSTPAAVTKSELTIDDVLCEDDDFFKFGCHVSNTDMKLRRWKQEN